MESFSIPVLLSVLLWPSLAAATPYRGSVRAADQFIPGATVTARQGGIKHVTYTDEAGRYTLDLEPGVWEIQVEILGLTPAQDKITVGAEPVFKDWVLEMPRWGETAASPPKPAAAAPAAPPPQPGASKPPPSAKPVTERAKAGPPGSGRLASRPGRPGQPQGPGFQNANVRATEEGQQALSEMAAAPVPGEPAATEGLEAEDAFLVSGSTSGGLAASSDDEARRQRMMMMIEGGRGGPGGPMMGGGYGEFMGPAGLGLPPGMGGAQTGDNIGLGGFGASAINGGFGGGFGGGPGGDPGVGGFGRGGPGGGPGGAPGGPGGGMRGGGAMGGGPGRGGPAARETKRDRRGPGGGQWASFGNRRSQPTYMGSIYLSLNNSALNAAPFSLNGQAAPKPSYAQSRFGLNFGGPLMVPKLFTWRRANFSFTYSGSVSRNPYSHVSSLPTLAERAGDFSEARANTSVNIYDPLSQTPFPGNIIPASRINPIATGLLKYFPLPTYTGLIQNYQIVRSTPNNSNSFGVRFIAPLSRRDRLSFNVQTQSRDSKTQQLFGFRDSSTGSGLSSSAGWSHSFAPRFNNNANVSFSRNLNQSVPYFANTEDVAALLGISGVSQLPINWGPPNLSFTNFGSLSDGSASLTRNQTTGFNEGITYILKRKHNLTFGFIYRRMQQNSLTYQNARGAFTFSGLLTSALDANGQPLPRTGFDFADFLLGFPQSSSLRYGSDNNYFRSWSTSVYAQDDFRLSRRVSLNFGLRYEYFAPYTELRGHLANLDLNPTFTAVSVVTAGQPAPFSGALPTSLIRPDPDNLSPRFGFAWRPPLKRNTVVRGGYSIFYSGASYAQFAAQMASQPPFATTRSLATSAALPLTLASGFPVVPAQNITNTFAIDPNYKLSYAQTWVFALQNSLPHGLVVELEYIGTKGTNLGILYQPNRAPPGTSLLNAQQQLPIPNATGFSYQTSHANSSFNSGQVRITRRFMRGFAANALYMYSKALDNASSFTGAGGAIVQFNDNLRLERGLSNFDQRHRLQTGFLLSSPVGTHGIFRNGGWKTRTLTGWTLTGAFSASSGTPLTARVAGNLSNTGGTAAFGTGRAQATGLSIDAGDYPYFNLLAFTTPPPGHYGNAGRNTIPGPFLMSLNASLNRAFRFGDTRRILQLRLSASNVMNHVSITSFGTTVNSSTYGLPTAASATRTVNLLLRFNF